MNRRNLMVVMLLLAFINPLFAQKVIPMPSFTLVDLENNQFTEKDVALQAGLILYFNPLCDICRQEMKMIQENNEYFESKQVILVSPGKVEDMKWFIGDFPIFRNSGIKVLHDPKDKFYKNFNATGYPTIYIFNKNKEITKKFDGATPMEDIMNEFQSQEKLVQHKRQDHEALPDN